MQKVSESNTISKRKPMPQHWYLIYTTECPPCGRTKTTREHKYGPRPDDIDQRYEWHQYWCGCGGY